MDKEFDIDFDDKIFSLKNPVPPLGSLQGPCRLCQKQSEFCCEFCGHNACEDCLYKKRKFIVSKNEVTNEISIQSGKICKICDR